MIAVFTTAEVLIRQAGVESTVERHGGLFKAVLKRMITEHAVQGFDDIKIAIAEAVSTKNNLSRNGSFSQSQWVFGTCHGDLETNLMSKNSLTWDPCKDSSSQVLRSPDMHNLELSARRAFIRENCGRRVARVVLRKAAPLVGEYATGDIVCCRKEDQGWSLVL